MELQLELIRNDILQTAPAAPGTLKVLPQGHNKQQKVALGDSQGVVQCCSIKKGEVVAAFKALPTGQPVGAVTLGKGQNQRDKIFIASEHTIRGLSKKGKEFFRFQAHLVDAIRTLHVADASMWVTGEFVMHQFLNNKEVQFYQAPDRINAVEVVPVKEDLLLAVLGCQDRTLRVLHNSQVAHQVQVEGAVTSLKYILDSHDPGQINIGRREVLYGTDGGILGQLFLDSEGFRRGWTVPNPNRRGAIQAIYSGIDFTKDGINDIVVGRDDGWLEIWGMDDAAQPKLVFSSCLPESIISLDGGFFTSPNVQDVVVQTFSGKVIAFAEPGAGLGSPLKRTKKEEAPQDRIRALRAELAELHARVDKERKHFAQISASLAPSIASVTLQSKFVLDPEEACYVLTLESGTPIASVALQSSVLLDLQDSASNSAILSVTPSNPDEGSATLATYRCPESATRVEMRMRVVEGQHGSIQAFVIPQRAPKLAQAVTQRIRPLCLHQRVEALAGTPPMNELRVSGSFSMAEIHTWVLFCLPEVPQRPASPEEATLYFRSSLLGTQLACQYKAGEAIFRGDNVSSLAVLREALMGEAASQKARISVSFCLEAASVGHVVGLLWPRFAEQRSAARRGLLLTALQELKMQDENVDYLTPEYKAILADADKSRQAGAGNKADPLRLEYLSGVFKDLYLDWQRFNGLVAPLHRIPQLAAVLHDPQSTQLEVVAFMLQQR
ncbi:hypothetical protein WJX72_000727 [[Myrmecia] bisecta]|uniref:Bardet-Biedl syndrome 7 n=1 Tax=[Myrmecia] bisecta TaxID=41462 RepID=A0AAW1P0N0_9CHLO